jgi:tRNA-Thr(GGU) m(6)t(6)A37 methyltransferase TsaA
MSGGEHHSPLVLEPIGRVESPIADPTAAARQPDEGAPGATLVLRHDLGPALDGLRVGDGILVLTWLHLARRDELTTHARNDRARPRQGVFSTRSPDRPNPIGVHRTTIAAIDGMRIVVDHFEAVHGTPVLDIKPVLVARGERDSVASTP